MIFTGIIHKKKVNILFKNKKENGADSNSIPILIKNMNNL